MDRSLGLSATQAGVRQQQQLGSCSEVLASRGSSHQESVALATLPSLGSETIRGEAGTNLQESRGSSEAKDTESFSLARLKTMNGVPCTHRGEREQTVQTR